MRCPEVFRDREEIVEIFAMHGKETLRQQAEAGPRRPEYWPSNEPWPPVDGPIVDIYRTINPQERGEYHQVYMVPADAIANPTLFKRLLNA